jgi:hypothetical protein
MGSRFARAETAKNAASACFLTALVVLPAGFFLGGAWARAGDPGVGAALVPVGAALAVIGAVIVARALR